MTLAPGPRPKPMKMSVKLCYVYLKQSDWLLKNFQPIRGGMNERPLGALFINKLSHSRPLFLYFRLFNTVLIQLIANKIAANWIRIADLWCPKRLLYQLSHNHCPNTSFSVSVYLTTLLIHNLPYLTWIERIKFLSKSAGSVNSSNLEITNLANSCEQTFKE